MDPSLAKSYKPATVFKKYSSRDVIIYALGINATTKRHLQFLYENHENFQVFSTYLTTHAHCLQHLEKWPGVAYDVGKLVFGEISIEFFEDPLPKGVLRQEASILDILDKKSGALILYKLNTFDETRNVKLARQIFSMFQKDAGNFGGPKNSSHENEKVEIPRRKPDKVVEEQTSINQAALFRMAEHEDSNPVHIDPDFCHKMGYDGTPVHGLANFGICIRHVMDHVSNNYSRKIHKAQARFSSIVYPDQTLVTEIWNQEECIIFQAKVKETGKVAVTHAYVTFRD